LWISHENLLFLACARNYLSKKLKSNWCNEEIEMKEWIKYCKEWERYLIDINTIPGDCGNADEDKEIDFCCNLCKCPWDHLLNHTYQHCGSEYFTKYHRACCHGYQDKEEFKSFVLPMGKTVNTLEGGGTEISNRPELEHENGTKVNRGINSVSIVDGNNEMFHKCLQMRQNRMRWLSA
jgi:hypothetical protein